MPMLFQRRFARAAQEGRGKQCPYNKTTVHRTIFALLPLALLTLAAFGAPPVPKPATPTIHFNRDIRPILSDNCYYCHGPDKDKRQAGLRLDVRADALKFGAFVPGKPAQSKLIARLQTTDPDEMMPPPTSHKVLTPAQKALFSRWIAEGAQYEAFWAYAPPKRPAVPKIAKGWASFNAIDAFVQARLVQEKIAPSAQADKRTLLRRVTLDLTGLPPTPQEMAAFLADKSPQAYEKTVDRLLSSPHYGERMATPWLDVARYADTVGFHGDQNQNAWPYRDYVIDAFNKNKPYDQFVIEQIAGDLLPNPTPEQLTATAFNRLNMVTREGGAQAKEYLAKYAADRVRTVSVTFLGSTMGCAECHDHKFDPFTQRDFYAMASYFGDVKQWGVYADYGYNSTPDIKGFNNDSPFPPEAVVPSRALQARLARLKAQQNAVAQSAKLAGSVDAINAHLAAHPDGWETPAVSAYVTPAVPAVAKGVAKPAAAVPDAPHPAFRTEADQSVTLTNAAPADVALGLPFARSGRVASVRVAFLPSVENAGSVFRKNQTGAAITLAATLVPGRDNAPPVRLKFRYAGANFRKPTYRNGSETIGVQNGWTLDAAHSSEPNVAVYVLDTPVSVEKGDELIAKFANLNAGRVRVSVSPLVPTDLSRPQILMPAQTPLSRLLATAQDPQAFAEAVRLEGEILACRNGKTPVLVTEATKDPLVTRVLPRGNWQDESGPVVAPAAPRFLTAKTVWEKPARKQTRLDLARWIVAPENPLTARTFANRLWKQFFGNGLSGVVEDLGAQGEWPSHPELLDWLAVEFRASGWNVKHLVRLIVTSATYRQSSSLRGDLRDRDPNNRWLASQNPRRLEAEFVRDNALAIAGLLSPEQGGPPAYPYQPDNYYAAIQFPDRPYRAETDAKQYRRGVYVHWQRTFLQPSLLAFDAPSREDCTAARTVANTPQQALTLLNDPTYVEAARVWATQLTKQKATEAARLELAYQRALSRAAKPREKASLLAFLARARQEYRARPEDAEKLLRVGNAPPPPLGANKIELAAWTSVCRVLLNLNETITRY